MSYNNGPRIVTNGLVLHLDAGNSRSIVSGSATWRDLSGNGCNATLQNGPTFNSSNSGYIAFDGTNDYADLANPSKITGNQVSCCMWVHPQVLDGASIIWLSASQKRFFQVHLPFGGTVYFDASNDIGGGYDRISFSFDSAYRGLKHWTFIKNSTAGTMTAYVNGVLVASGTGLNRPVGVPDYGVIAHLPSFSGTTAYNNTRLYSMQFYNKALSAEEIRQNYHATKGRFGL
jgi:hypothetical protein